MQLVIFADASHSDNGSQLCYISGLIIGEISKEVPFHLLSWTSHKSRRPAKSTAAAETFAASEAIDEILVLKNSISKLFGKVISTTVFVDSKDLYHSLSSKRNAVDKSMRNEVNHIRFVFETALDIVAWICGSLNISDVGTKKNSKLTELFQSILHTGKLQLDLSDSI